MTPIGRCPRRAIFLSDLHLDAVQDNRYMIFVDLLKDWQKPQPIPLSHLFLVGDIFDLWLGKHKNFIQKHAVIIKELSRLQQQGIEIHYFEGNHDLYLKSFWQDQLGFHVHEGPLLFSLGSLQLFIEHGDEYDPKDRGYHFLRWLLRTQVFGWVIKNVPDSIVMALGKKASASSRQYTTQIKTLQHDQTLDRLHDHAQQVAALHPHVDLIINGHVHIRDDYKFVTAISSCATQAAHNSHAAKSHNPQNLKKNVRAINLGSWLQQPYSYLEILEDLNNLEDQIKFHEATMPLP